MNNSEWLPVSDHPFRCSHTKTYTYTYWIGWNELCLSIPSRKWCVNSLYPNIQKHGTKQNKKKKKIQNRETKSISLDFIFNSYNRLIWLLMSLRRQSDQFDIDSWLHVFRCCTGREIVQQRMFMFNVNCVKHLDGIQNLSLNALKSRP